MVKVGSHRKVGDKENHDKRYYISSLICSAEHIATTTQSHWSIENQLHWVLDVSFGEDRSKIRDGHAPHNIALVRHAIINAINLTRQDKPKRNPYETNSKRSYYCFQIGGKAKIHKIYASN